MPLDSRSGDGGSSSCAAAEEAQRTPLLLLAEAPAGEVRVAVLLLQEDARNAPRLRCKSSRLCAPQNHQRRSRATRSHAGTLARPPPPPPPLPPSPGVDRDDLAEPDRKAALGIIDDIIPLAMTTGGHGTGVFPLRPVSRLVQTEPTQLVYCENISKGVIQSRKCTEHTHLPLVDIGRGVVFCWPP